MKILYTNHIITPYTHAIMQRVVSKGADIVFLLPRHDNGSIGKGVVAADLDGGNYQVRYSATCKKWYGKAALTDLDSTLMRECPDILLIGWPYMLQLFFDRKLRKIIKSYNIKLIIQEIPFQTPPYGQINYFKEHPSYDENMKLLSTGLGFKLRSIMTMWMRKKVYSLASATLNYATCAYDILPSYGVKKESIFVRYNTVDTDALFAARMEIERKGRLLSERPRIIHVGRLVKWKRVDLLIEAFKTVIEKFPDCELVIVGKGPEQDSLMRQVVDAHLTDNVVFTGGIYDPLVLGQYMYESSVYVLAGMGGLSINDAMGYSLPIICSVCDGTEKDLVTDGVNGYFFKENDAVDLADKIVSVLSDPEKAKQMGEASYRVIREKINLETVSQRYMDAFNYVMGVENLG